MNKRQAKALLARAPKYIVHVGRALRACPIDSPYEEILVDMLCDWEPDAASDILQALIKLEPV